MNKLLNFGQIELCSENYISMDIKEAQDTRK